MYCKINLIGTKFHIKSYLWKCNNLYLQDPVYNQLIQDEWQYLLFLKRHYFYATSWWEKVVSHFTFVSKTYIRQNTHERNERCYYCQQLLDAAVSEFCQGRIGVEEVRRLQAQLYQVLHEYKQGVKIRSNFQQLGITEEANYKHLEQERRRGKMQYWTQYCQRDGSLVQGHAIYKSVYNDFRDALQTIAPPNHDAISAWLDQFTFPQLSHDEVSTLMDDFTLNELEVAITQMNRRTSAGLSGMNLAWLYHFRHLLFPELIIIFNEIKNTHRSNARFWTALGVLLVKQPGVPAFDNVRLISIFSMAYKLLTKCIQLRLKRTIIRVLHPSQGGISGTNPMAFILSQLRELIQYKDMFKGPAVGIMLVDLQRAFDNVSHAFFFAVMTRVGFPQVFIAFLQYIFTQKKISVSV